MLILAADITTGVHEQERILYFVLLQLIVIILFARMGGELMRRLGQPRVVGEILAGLVLGPTLLGSVFPEVSSYLFESVTGTPIHVLSQIGLILLMFQIGLDFEFSHLKERRNRNAVIAVSAAGIGLPFGLGFWLGHISAPILAPGIDELGYKLFIATAMSITAIPILGRIMAEFDLNRTRLGAIAITSAAFNDVTGWVLLAVISAMVTAQFSSVAVAAQLLLMVAFFAVSWWVVRPLLKRYLHFAGVTADELPLNVVAVVLGLIFLAGLFTYKIGIFAIFGGFMMGVLLFDCPGFVQAWKRKVADFVTVFFLPIFFTYTGLRTDVHGLDSLSLWLWCGAVIVVATIGKFAGCYLASRASGLNHYESSCIGIMMNTRALMELIVINVGYDLGVIPQSVSTMLVLMAIFSTVVTAPLLRWWLPKMGHIVPVDRDV